jgi:hypothetical protein
MFAAALFWGSVWGLAEATLGHLLHLARIPGLPGLVMVPVAAAVMGRAAVRSRSAGAVFLAGVVAASFKLLDLFVPGTDVLALSRPIQAILLEALAGAVWMKLAKMGTFTFFEQDQRRAAIPVRGQSLTIEPSDLLTTGRP